MQSTQRKTPRTTAELLQAMRDALALSLTRQQMQEFDETARLRPDIIDYYAGLATARDTVRR